ncbi:MAG: type I glutamate--ammonia ligase [Methanomassiliicoccales archaeon]
MLEKRFHLRDEKAPAEKPKISHILSLCETGEIKMVDFKFTDLPGTLQHITIPSQRLNTGLLEEGIGFDGSSIRGFAEIHESDMILIPDINTVFIDPVCKTPTASFICNVFDPVTKERYWRDPRYIAQKAENYMKSKGIADSAFFGPEAEFFVFDSVRFDHNQNSGYYFIDSHEGAWNSGREGSNLGYRPRYKEGYFPAPPIDSLMEFRSEAVSKLTAAGIDVEVHHHEVATGGQCEIGIKFQSLVKMADHLVLYKYILKNLAKEQNKTVTFMPKPLFQDNGSGMHVHISLSKNNVNLFYDAEGYAQLSLIAMYFIGGLLTHSPALLALTSPTTNSYRRLVPGYEAPVNLVYSQRNRSAAIRIPVSSQNPKSKRIEYRPPDPSCNPYLAFAAILMAGIDGIERRIDPGEPLDVDIFELSKEKAKKIRTVPGSLDDALNALANDHEFLLKGGVFTKDLIDTWIDYKLRKEYDQVRLRPHPYEFVLYYDV